MLVLAAFLLTVLTVPLAGGRLERLGDVRFRASWALYLGLGLQVVVLGVVSRAPEGLLRAGHVLSYLALGWFIVANRHAPGMPLLGLGTAANFAAIVANGGVMPASAEALASAGITPGDGGFLNSTFVPDARLAVLGDVFAVPESWPASNVFSVGDVVIVLGVAVGLHVLTGSRLSFRQPPHSPLATRRAPAQAADG